MQSPILCQLTAATRTVNVGNQLHEYTNDILRPQVAKVTAVRHFVLLWCEQMRGDVQNSLSLHDTPRFGFALSCCQLAQPTPGRVVLATPCEGSLDGSPSLLVPLWTFYLIPKRPFFGPSCFDGWCQLAMRCTTHGHLLQSAAVLGSRQLWSVRLIRSRPCHLPVKCHSSSSSASRPPGPRRGQQQQQDDHRVRLTAAHSGTSHRGPAPTAPAWPGRGLRCKSVPAHLSARPLTEQAVATSQHLVPGEVHIYWLDPKQVWGCKPAVVASVLLMQHTLPVTQSTAFESQETHK